MAQILEPEENEVVALQLADADLVECGEELLTRCEVAARKRGHVHVAASVVIEALVDAEVTSHRRDPAEDYAIQALAFRA